MGKLGALLYLLVLIGLSVHADDNHIHVEQVNGGDNMDLQIDQIGYDNMIKFSFDHQNNIMDDTCIIQKYVIIVPSCPYLRSLIQSLRFRRI